MWSLPTSPACPEKVREHMAKWGLAKDEFTDTDHWPHQLYVREARRMVGDYVMTEHDCRREKDTPDAGRPGRVHHGLAQLLPLRHAGRPVQNEGDVQVGAWRPLPDQLPVASCRRPASARTCWCRCACRQSHIAYGSIRMEPVFMVLGQVAATAAVLAIDDKVDVQKVDYEKLRKRLLADKQVLDFDAPNRRPRAIDPRKLPASWSMTRTPSARASRP